VRISRILDDDQLVWAALEAGGDARLAAVGEQQFLESRIGPRLGDDPGPCAGVRLSMSSTCRRISSAVNTPFSIRSSRSAISIAL